MKTISILFIFILTALNSIAQITFEKGYFIDNNNQRVECLIKNNDWKNNPKEFEYKLNENAAPLRGSTGTVKEFGIIGYSKYVMANTKIDLSPVETGRLSEIREPEWSQQNLFLKVLIDGKATLYTYTANGMERFFYSVSDSAIKQLICKQYFISTDQAVFNHDFRKQLWSDVRWENATQGSVEILNYTKSDLVKYFKIYNKDNSDTSAVIPEVHKPKSNKNPFHLKITPGINYSALSVNYTSTSGRNYKYYPASNNQINFRISVEAEYVLPFNKNKWGIVFEPTYQYFKSTENTDNVNIVIDYKSIEFPVGIRHYFFINDNLTVFVNSMLIPSFFVDFNSKFRSSGYYETSLDIKPGVSFSIGSGIGFKKLSAEVRYYTNRNLLQYAFWSTNYTRLSVILGLKIF